MESEPRLFANDTCLLAKGLNSEQLKINRNTELRIILICGAMSIIYPSIQLKPIS